ncbi:MAG: prepilin-type N-terminal cleavage/methylation domain-containing protein [Elusimicrobia bacterium]|nr:prepilin-type N-terminal cleavage/methylation domain-containing protein [Elusimicrobiota bacterium]
MLKIKGFTFPEVIITIAIVGILSMAAVPVYKGYVRKSISVEGKSLLAEVNAAEQIYFARNGSFYPTTANGAGDDKLILGVNAEKNKYFTSYTVKDVKRDGDDWFFTATTEHGGKTITLKGSLNNEPVITDEFSTEG